MKNKHLVFLVVLLSISTFHSIAQSVEINPTNPIGFISSVGGLNSSIENLSKIGTSKLRIEGLLKNDNFSFTSGSANIELVGNPNSGNSSGIVSNQNIIFKHGNTLRWSMGDAYNDYFSSYIEDRFAIYDHSLQFNQSPLFINRGSNQVDIKKLRINSDPSIFNDGFLIESGTGRSMVINNQLDSPIHLQTNNLTRVTLVPSGNFGVGTTDPQRKLDVAGTARFSETLEVTGNTTLSQNLIVNGTSKIGVNGSTLTQIIKTSSTFDLGNILASSSVIQTVTVTNAGTGSTVHISPGSALPDGIVIAYARVSAANTVEIKFTNVKTTDINPPNITYQISIIR